MSALPQSPAALRNREPIARALASELPESGMVLEIASGNGEHVTHFARAFANLQWQPTDCEPDKVRIIEAVLADESLVNVSAPTVLDAALSQWPVKRADALYCANMVHISPWASVAGLFAGAGRVLGAGAPLVLYGPFFEDGVTTAASNLSFDESLKARDPRWGIRRLAALDDLAGKHGFMRKRRIEMPANNLLIVYRKPK